MSTYSAEEGALPDAACWRQALTSLAQTMAAQAVHPAGAVVLLPYVQLIAQAQQQWATQTGGSGFLPRFETTMNWASSLSGSLGLFVPAGPDIRLDVAIDLLTAAALLDQAGLGAQQDALADRLLEAAYSLAPIAAAIHPDERLAWGQTLAQTLQTGLESPVLALEAAVGRIALAWCAASAYASDRLFDAQPTFFAALQGFQVDPLAGALLRHFSDASPAIPLCPPYLSGAARKQPPALHAALDAEDEAERAAACVLTHLAQGRQPVALIAQDRQLTRRVGALLAGRGVAMRDETGWTLSTTRAAAQVMGLLRAMPWSASTDAVTDWLKNAPAFLPAEVNAAEAQLRRQGLRAWRDVPTAPVAAFADVQRLSPRVQAVRELLARARPLAQWLGDLRAALQTAGQWDDLLHDPAGQTVLDALRLHEGQAAELDFAPSKSLSGFTQWVQKTLEGGKFQPRHPPLAQVVILPLAQLLGRPMQAVVLPGCDEVRLPASPEPRGLWTTEQRALLGLPSRAMLAASARAAWHYALQLPHVDVLWRCSEGGERLIPSGLVQTLLLDTPTPLATDTRLLRSLQAQPTPRPLPQGNALPVARLSASAYEDMRRCPYRFFALRQLRLQESDELDAALGKRDFGNWLHALLGHFQEALQAQPSDDAAYREALLNTAADRATLELGLTESEFLPFTAIWPSVRSGYLSWLQSHEATGACFELAEAERSMAYGDLMLIGKLDRIDRLPPDAAGQAGQTLLIDYKTEPASTTQARIKNGAEDTQLAFYAALMSDDTLQAAYVNLGEKSATKTYAQTDIVALRDDLIDGILSDMARIAEGVPLPALGEGKTCDFCAARGLCRKDFWT